MTVVVSKFWWYTCQWVYTTNKVKCIIIDAGLAQDFQLPSISVQFTTNHDRNESCIRCTFTDESISACVAIHFSASQLSRTNGLLSINILKIDRGINDLVASHCIRQEQLNLTHHTIMVFSYNGSIIGPAILLREKRINSIINEGKIHYNYDLQVHYVTYNCAGVVVLFLKIALPLGNTIMHEPNFQINYYYCYCSSCCLYRCISLIGGINEMLAFS